MSLRRLARGVLCATTLVAGCGGSGVEGRYAGKGDSFFDSLTFKSDGKVEIVLVGASHEGLYKIDGNSVTITAPSGDQSVLAIDSNGCLTHQIAGTYCRSEGSAAVGTAAATSNASGIFEAIAQEGRITLELGADQQVRVTMVPNPGSDMPNRMSFDATYEANDGGMIINLPGDEPLRLTRSGNDFEGTMNGETVRFVRR